MLGSRLLMQEDAYVEFLRIRKVPIEERPKSNSVPDVVPLVCVMLFDVSWYRLFVFSTFFPCSFWLLLWLLVLRMCNGYCIT
jgi:hypothetical protein